MLEEGEGYAARPLSEILLTPADLCNALSDLSDAEKEAEILPISVQQVYVLTQMGRIDEAEQLSTAIAFAEFVPPRTSPIST